MENCVQKLSFLVYMSIFVGCLLIPSTAQEGSSDTLPPGKPIHFVLKASLEFKDGDTLNMLCFAEMTVPGPDGWMIRTPPGVKNNSTDKKIEIVKSHYPAFEKLCSLERALQPNNSTTYTVDRLGDPDIVKREIERMRSQGMIEVKMQ